MMDWVAFSKHFTVEQYEVVVEVTKVVSERWLHSTRCARKNRKFQKCGRVDVDGDLSQEATECKKCALGRRNIARGVISPQGT